MLEKKYDFRTAEKAMQKLCEQADIMLPNITEAAMMAGMEYAEEFDMEYIDPATIL